MKIVRRLTRAALLLALAAAPAGGCRRDDDGTKPTGGELPPLTIRDETGGLLLTFIDERGETHTVLHPKEVPAASRPLVRVVVADREEGTRDQFFVVDLTQPEADGGYRTKTMARRDWEAVILKRRGGGATAPPPVARGSAAPSGDVTVIIYGASWCSPCHQAADYLKSIGVPYVLKDVDEDEGARREMQAKLKSAGGRAGSIPVIDVRGEIIVGYNQGALNRAIAKAKRGTAL